ncbi:AAA family ATPase [Plantactinospora sp. WMMC1484]|uniref:AAA family ATPase n=1 Tax=Plantactinospora sp. WMMC1484 TaxID=3404122 RepID=UPI003BF5F37B
MPAYILTGTPGSGKTAILRQLEVDGHTVVEEAATDVIAHRHALGQMDVRPASPLTAASRALVACR